MYKRLIKFLFVCFSFFILSFSVNASELKGRVNYNNVNLRTGPGTSYDIIKALAINSEYTLVNGTKVANEGGCSSGWYQIVYAGRNAYVCSTYLDLFTKNESNDEPTTECETSLKSLGFPKSYWDSLCALKEKYPNWSFVPDFSGLDFNTTIQKESVDGQSFISSSTPGYLSTSPESYDYLTDTFTLKEGSTWYAANEKVVAYYLDPRNFLDERYIFMFEKLSYDSSYQTLSAVESALAGRDMVTYAQNILDAASANNINAIYLASKIRQETGGNFSNYSLKGTSITANGNYYEHVYNPYNIGAYNGAYAGLVWAASGSSYLRPWTTLATAISGGASMISSTYISKGQDSIYFQKFNTSSYSKYNAYSHQYMTNIRGAAGEASIAYNGYNGMELLSTTAFQFVIPVYENMSNEPGQLPDPGNPNNHLKLLKINNELISDFEHDVYEYTYYVGPLVSSINVITEVINSNATVSGDGIVNLVEGENIINIDVTAQNGDIQRYVIKVTKANGSSASMDELINAITIPKADNYFLLNAGFTVGNLVSEFQKISSSVEIKVLDKQSGNLSTGDNVEITLNDEKITFVIVIKGDPSGDGNINIMDLLMIQKNILGYTSLSGSYLKAADTNQDGKVDIADLLRVQKHILGYLKIS